MPHGVLNRQSSLDRFIRRMSALNFESLSEDRTPVCITNFKNTAKDKFHLENYQKALRNALLLRPLAHYNFFSTLNEDIYILKIPTVNHWPVEPRTKPILLSEPELVLDMPDVATEIWKTPVDWGSTGYIATIYNSAVYFWNPEKKTGFTYLDLKVRHCIKWNRAGTKLAISIAHGSRIAILDFQQQKITLMTNFCPCNVNLNRRDCEMCCVEWTSKNILISGCSKGTITYWASNDLAFINGRIRAHSSHIIKMSLSCNEKYLVTVGKDNIVMVWSCPWLEVLKEVTFKMALTKAVAWHPWNEALLAIGDVKCFYILNVQSQNMFCSPSNEGCCIYNLTFNPRSGELLLSVFDTIEGASYLRVMRNMNTVVDEIRCNEDKILYLLWDSTGTKLGTVSTDEYFCIWNFFGKSTKPEKKYLKKEIKQFSTCPSVNNFSHTIR